MFRNIFSTAVEIVLFPLMVALSAIFAGAVIIHIFRNTHYNASTGWIYCPALTGTGYGRR